MNSMESVRPLPRMFIAVFVLLLLVFPVIKADAHALEQSYIFLGIDEASVTGRFEITIADLNKALELGLSTAGDVTRREIEPYISSIRQYYLRHVNFASNGQVAELLLGDSEILSITLGQYVVIHFALQNVTSVPEYIDVQYQVLFDVEPEHRAFLVVENNWRTGTFNNEAVFSLIFDPDSMFQRLDLSSSTVLHGFWGMVKLGTHHIWVGISTISQSRRIVTWRF